MLKFTVLFYFILSCSFMTKAQHPPIFDGIKMDTACIKLSDLMVNLVTYSYGKPAINLLVVHDDEDTGVKAAFDYIQFSGGSIVDCQYGGQRNFNFNYQGHHFITDPNSIYTYEGVITRLDKFGNTDNDDVLELLQKAGKTILETYNTKKTGYIFTLHNNADGGFGIASYLKGYDLEQTADSVYINFQMDPDDLILVTEKELFNRLKQQNVNVVLQSENAVDDGSLSIYAMQNKLPYINVEVQHGHQYEHLRLLEIAIKVLHEAYPHLN